MIKLYNRKTKNYEIEKVSGENYLNWLYNSKVGMSFLESLIKRKAFSYFYGKFCDSSLSKSKIEPFIKDFSIDMNESLLSLDKFNSFNEFFTRKLKNNARKIDMNPNSLISLGDGRLSAYNNINLNNIVQIKGLHYSLYDLIDDKNLCNKYDNGVCLILRLCPTDYHRFHFIDNGVCQKSHFINGHYYSVNPIALKKIPRLFCENKREYSVFHSENFGDVLYVEVGATCVGSIIQTYKSNINVHKGDEKGYFKFGGSTVIMFFEPNKVLIDNDILNETNKGFETKVLMGEKIGSSL